MKTIKVRYSTWNALRAKKKKKVDGIGKENFDTTINRLLDDNEHSNCGYCQAKP